MLLNVYEWRARRILRALLTVILVSVPLAWVWMTPDALRDFGQSVAAMMLLAWVADNLSVRYLDHTLCATGTCGTKAEGASLSRDEGHLSIEGAVLMSRRMGLIDFAKTNADAFYAPRLDWQHDG